MFESTQPPFSPDLTRASAFRRHLQEMERTQGLSLASTRFSTLSPSLVQDLMRFEQGPAQSTVLDVAAASVRHQHALRVHLQAGVHLLPLTFFPRDRLAHCLLDDNAFQALDLARLQVLQVEPAALRPPGDADRARVGDPLHYRPLGPLLWALALRGPRAELLPEIGGLAAYRVAASMDLATLPVSGVLAEAAARLKRDTYTLHEVAAWPGLGVEGAARLLNALYLQAGLMVSRTHPAVTNENWRSASERR